MVLLIQRLGTQPIEKMSASKPRKQEDALGLARKKPSPSVGTKLAWGAGILATVALAPRLLLHLVPKSTWQKVEEYTLYKGKNKNCISKCSDYKNVKFLHFKEDFPRLERHYIPFAKNQVTQAWFHPSKEGKPTLLLSLGNLGPLSNLNAYRDYIRKGYGVITYEYPGFGTTDGQPTEASILKTAKAVSDFLVQQKRIPTTQQVLVGHSLGCNPSVHLAEQGNYKALILNAPMSSFPELVRKKIGALSKWIPIQNHIPSRWNNHYIITKLKIPLFIITFKNDPIIHAELSRILYNISKANTKQLQLIEGNGHVVPPIEVLKEVTSFLNGLDS